MSDVTRRIARWEVKCTPERTKATLDAIRENMKERYESATVALSLMEAEVKQGHVPSLVEIDGGPHTTLVDLPCFVNLCL